MQMYELAAVKFFEANKLSFMKLSRQLARVQSFTISLVTLFLKLNYQMLPRQGFAPHNINSGVPRPLLLAFLILVGYLATAKSFISTQAALSEKAL